MVCMAATNPVLKNCQKILKFLVEGKGFDSRVLRNVSQFSYFIFRKTSS